MRPEDVPNELLLAFINAAMAAGKPVIIQVSAIRAALAPLIAAAERERVAAAMESYEVQTKVGAIIRKIHVGPAIAAAIRALKETT